MARALHGVEVPHLYHGEVVHTSRKYDERLTVALLAQRLAPRRAGLGAYHPASAYHADDFPALLARVAYGPETWRGREERFDPRLLEGPAEPGAPEGETGAGS